VELAEGSHRLVIGALHFGRLGDVGGDARDFCLGRLADGGDSLADGLLLARHDRDVRAFGREPRRHGEPEPLAAACDDGRTARESDVHASLLGGRRAIMPKGRALSTPREASRYVRAYGIVPVALAWAMSSALY